MIFGGSSEEAGGAAHEEAKADAGHEVEQAGEQSHEPASEPRTSAEGGKRWSESDAKDEIRSEAHDTSEAKPEGEHAEAKADGPNEADAAGAAWLEKFRAQQAAPKAEGAGH
ncbi:hypothetical protein N7E02_10210 [Aliirhizobium terrae]|uniref:hypothetical protein n=1 Tax=Terrirhizobium terrae TaxID=2926709 RepID=UPI0025786235|nr:hypothetical protein [Rhizobium sp. CC-CFT758]WJH40906.1 hypothetical protein N7E02_10210 [Rhizobium sp. CC-CFT758]